MVSFFLFHARRDLAGGLLSSIIDLANFQAAPISLQGLSEANVNMLQARAPGLYTVRQLPSLEASLPHFIAPA